MMLPQGGPKPPQKNLNQSAIIGDGRAIERPSQFFYEHDFDENGVLFYLGSYGRKKMW